MGTSALVATTATAMAWEDTVDTVAMPHTLAMPDTPVWDMPDMVVTPDTVLELTDIMLDTMASTETELRVLPVSTALTFPFPVPVRSVMLRLRLNPRLRLMPLPITVMLMVDTPMLPVLTDTDTGTLCRILWWTLGRILRWTLRIRRNSPIPFRNLPQQPRRSSPLLILFFKNHSK